MNARLKLKNLRKQQSMGIVYLPRVVMDIYIEHFHCVELISEKHEISTYPTQWGAACRCHDLNKWNPLERWTVRPTGVRYVLDCNELTPKSFKASLERHFEAVKDTGCDCLFCRNLNKRAK